MWNDRHIQISFKIFLQIALIRFDTVLSHIFNAIAICVIEYPFRRKLSILISSSLNGQRSRNRWYSS